MDQISETLCTIFPLILKKKLKAFGGERRAMWSTKLNGYESGYVFIMNKKPPVNQRLTGGKINQRTP